MTISNLLNKEELEFLVREQISKLEKTSQDLRAEVIERKQAEEAVRRSEEKYRTLFNSIDEGFLIIEMIFDEDGKPADYWILEANRPQEKITGLRDIEGKRAHEVFYNTGNHWIKRFGRVALTGDPVRFEEKDENANRWLEV